MPWVRFVAEVVGHGITGPQSLKGELGQMRLIVLVRQPPPHTHTHPHTKISRVADDIVLYAHV